MNIETTWKTLGVIGAILASGWLGNVYMTNTYAGKGEVKQLKTSNALLMDARIAALRQQRDEIKRKPKKDAADLQDIDYLNKQIERLQDVQSGK